MEMIKFFESIKGRELLFFCVMLIAFQRLYLGFGGVSAHGTSFVLSATTMAVLTAGAVVRLERRVLERWRSR